MIKRNQPILNVLNAATDGVILFASYFVASWIRFGVMKGHLSLADAWSIHYREMFLIYSLMMVIVFFVRGAYGSKRKQDIHKEVTQVIYLNCIGIILFTSIQYFTKAGVFSRLTYLFFYLVSTTALVIKKVALKKALYAFRTNGKNLKHVVVVGNGNLAKQYCDAVKNTPEYGYQVDGYVSKVARDGLGKNLGTYEDLPEILDNSEIDELIVALEPHEFHFMSQVISSSEKSGVKVSVIPFYNYYLPANPVVEEIDNIKLFALRTTPFDDILNAFVKRLFDIVVSLILIIISSPVMLFAAIGTKITGGPGPIIFKQERVGLNRKVFTMYKFRSMRMNDEENKAWSQNTDSRKTKFGSFIRKFSIDELPQFFNVLKGDMSIIGPRPEIPYFVEQFKEEIPMYMIRHLVRPGITGWAQVNGYRGDTSIKKRIECDIWYIEHWSLMLDIIIVFRTVFGGMINSEKVGNQEQ